MTDLLEKFNVLVKSRLNDLVGGNLGRSRRRVRLEELSGKKLEAEVKVLRQKINEALDYEAQLRKNVATLQAEVARWDEQADAAVRRGDDDGARHAIDQHKRAQQRLVMAENDVQSHQLVTQELIARVNQLEASVADVRRTQESSAEPAPTQETQAEPERIDQAEDPVSSILDETREKVAQLGDMLQAKSSEDVIAAVDAEVDAQVVEDDLDRRRRRLSK